MAADVHVRGFDHLVLNVNDVEASLRFYCDELGLEPVRVNEWRRGDVPFPSARINASTIIDFAKAPRNGENCGHFCLVIDPTDFDRLQQGGPFEIEQGPAQRFGAQGYGVSLYVRDPDQNLVELRYYA